MKKDIVQIAQKMKLNAYKFELHYQNHRILRAAVNIHLAHIFRSENRNIVFPGKVENGNLTLRHCGITVNIEELTQSFDAIQRRDIQSLSPAMQTLLERPEMRNADEVMVRLAALCNPVRHFRNNIKSFSRKQSLEEQLAVLEELDYQTTIQLAYHFNIDDNPASSLHLPESSAIRPFCMYCWTYEENCLTPFCNEAGAIIYYVVRKKLNDHHVQLPVTNYVCSTGNEFPVYRMPDLSNGNMYPLYGLDKIYKFPETPVVLTDILEIASEFNCASEDLIVSGIYGGEDAIPQTDIRPLLGNRRKTYWLVLNRPGCLDETQTYRAGLKMLMNFRKYDRDLYFITPKDHRWRKTGELYSCKADFMELSLNQFLAKCRRLGITVPTSLDDMEIEVISGSQANLVEDEKPFITPIAHQGGFVIIYARAKAGKTFMALHTALAMAYGKDPIPDHWINAMRKPALVLYVSGEMTKAKFKKRKLREEASMNPPHELLDNIQFIHERTWRIDDPDAQKKYDRVIAKYMPDMIVLDNWQTLSTGSTARNAFDTFWRWISKWCDAGITIFLINHTNKDGKILGSGAQPGACDTALQFYQASNDDTIRILISPEEHRDGKRSLFQPILASLDFDNPGTPWIFETITLERFTDLKQWNDNGCIKSEYPEC